LKERGLAKKKPDSMNKKKEKKKINLSSGGSIGFRQGKERGKSSAVGEDSWAQG